MINIYAELAAAPWEFGYSTYRFLGPERIATVTQTGTRYELDIWNVNTGQQHRLDLTCTAIKPYLAIYGSRLAAIAADLGRGPRVLLVDPDSARTQELTEVPPLAPTLKPQHAETLQIPARHGTTYAIYYKPGHESAAPPPMLVRAHPGPTSNIQLRFDPWITFFTNNGFAVLDVDYHGSTGYGRAYRNALRTQWGVLDVADCIDAAQYVVDQGLAHAERLAICGSSAGGYTALRAIATTDTFTAAAIRYAVIDPAT